MFNLLYSPTLLWLHEHGLCFETVILDVSCMLRGIQCAEIVDPFIRPAKKADLAIHGSFLVMERNGLLLGCVLSVRLAFCI